MAPPKTAAEKAAAAAALAAEKEKQKQRKSTNNDTDSQTVTLGVLKEYLNDQLTERLNEQTKDIKNTIEEKFGKLQKDSIDQKKDIAYLKRTSKEISTAVASNDRRFREYIKANKEIVVTDHEFKAEGKALKAEVIEYFRNFDDEIADYEIRDAFKIGKDTLIRYVIKTSSEHVRDRILCKAIDGGLKTLKEGLPKAERIKKAKIHTLRKECDEKNKESPGDFLWDVYTPVGSLHPEIVRYHATDPKVKKLAAHYFPNLQKEQRRGRPENLRKRSE